MIDYAASNKILKIKGNSLEKIEEIDFLSDSEFLVIDDEDEE